MPEFRLTQISDCRLARNRPTLIENFHRVSEYIDTTRPDVVVNSGDISLDGPDRRDDLEFAKALHDALPIACRYLPGNRSRRRPRLCRREKAPV
jgi:3',5'-cyclic AMP phosphodiesterase CpdA